MSVPVPAPRTVTLSEVKKPVPKPRTSIPIARQPEEVKNAEENTKTFSRRVRTISNASKQIAGDIGDLVIEGTRQSVRKITKRFTSSSHEQSPEVQEDDCRRFDESIDVFSSIQFDSPINTLSSRHNNLDSESISSDDLVSLPPPLYPPPPLREESIYDAPPSVASSSTGSSGRSPVTFSKPEIYESVFPMHLYSSDTDSGLEANKSETELSRSASWKFYDPVSRNEGVYSNVDSTPPIKPINVGESNNNSNILRNMDEMSVSDVNSNCESLNRTNSLYENHELLREKLQSPLESLPRPSESVIFQFDPLSVNKNSYENVMIEQSNKKLLEELLQGELYGNISSAGTYDNWSLSNDDSDSGEYLNPPPPPARFDSLPDEPRSPKPKTEQPKSNWFTNDTPPSPPAVSMRRPVSTATENGSRKSSWLKQVNDALKKAPEVVRSMRNKDSVINRPALGPKSLVQHKGMLYKVQKGPVEDLFGEFSGRWCILENGNFVCYSDNTCDSIKEHFPMESILSIQILLDQKYKYR